jgi:hypothetical protein
MQVLAERNLLQNLIFERNAVRVVLVEPAIGANDQAN